MSKVEISILRGLRYLTLIFYSLKHVNGKNIKFFKNNRNFGRWIYLPYMSLQYLSISPYVTSMSTNISMMFPN